MTTPKKQFLALIFEYFSSEGFIINKSDGKISKVDSLWSIGFNFSFTKWSDGTYVKTFLFVDYSPLRDFYKKIIPDDNGYGIAGSEVGLTLNNNDFEITNEDCEIQLPLRNEEEINKAVADFIKLYESQIRAYLKRICDLKLLDEIYNKKPLSFNVSNYSDPGRLCTALILAKFTNRDNYEYLEKIYSDEMINNGYGDYENEFVKIREALKKIQLTISQ